jgi:hypothetical protein
MTEVDCLTSSERFTIAVSCRRYANGREPFEDVKTEVVPLLLGDSGLTELKMGWVEHGEVYLGRERVLRRRKGL